MAHHRVGISPSNFQDLTGGQFGRLTVLARAANAPGGKAKWTCQCECGSVKSIRGEQLKNGETTSCGCLSLELRTKHGMSAIPEFLIWQEMVSRCTNPDSTNYRRYGGRGISVCERWALSYENFIADMGLRPEGMSIERINNDGNYCPENCKWANRKEQARNRRSNHRLTCNGETLTLAEWSDRTGLPTETIRYRINRGWSEEAAVLTPKLQ